MSEKELKINIDIKEPEFFKNAEIVTIKGKKGDKGDKHTNEEIKELIIPLIPAPIKGDKGEEGVNGKDGKDGKDGTVGLDGFDGKDGKDTDPKEVASVLKKDKDFIKKTKGKDGSPDTPEQVKAKLLEVGILYDEIKNAPIFRAGSSKTVSLIELDDVDYSGISFVNGKYILGSGGSQDLQEVTDNGSTTTNSIEAQSFIKTGGVSTEFLKADGSVDSSTYLTTQPWDTATGGINYAGGNVGIANTSPATSLHVGAGSLLSIGAGGTAKAMIYDNVDAVSGVQMGNLSTGTFADFRFLIKDTTNHYFAFSQPSTGYSGPLFGIARSTSDYIFNTGGTARHMTIGTNSATNLYFGTTDAIRMTVLSGGNVGIGNTNPTERLYVSKASAVSVVDYDNKVSVLQQTIATANKIYSRVAMYDSTSIYGADIGLLYTGTQYAMPFSVNDNTSGNPIEIMRLQGNGNVGIGTTAPTYKLEVKGTGLANDGILVSTTAFTSIPNPGSVSAAVLLNARGFNMTVDGATVGASYQPELGIGLAANRVRPLLAIKNGATFPALVIEEGLVGLGTALPRERLDVTGNIALDWSDSSRMGMQFQTGTAYRMGMSFSTSGRSVSIDSLSADTSTGIRFRTGTVGSPVERMRLTSDGNVGIGTSAPTTKLQLQSTDNLQMRIKNTTASTFRYDFGQRTDGTAYMYNYSDGGGAFASLDFQGHPLIFKNNTGEIMRVASNDNVGIGTTAPNSPLEVKTGSVSDLIPSIIAGKAVTGGNSLGASFRNYTGTTGSSMIEIAGVTSLSPRAVQLRTDSSGNFSIYTGSTAYSTLGTERFVVAQGGNVGVGSTSPSARLHIISTTEQLRVGYDVSNYYTTIVASDGATTFNAVGSGSSFVFSDPVKLGSSSSTAIVNVFSATATLDFPSIPSNHTEQLTMTVTGAVVGDTVSIGAPSTLEAHLSFSAFVSATNTVAIRLHNSSGGALDPASATYRATVIRF